MSNYVQYASCIKNLFINNIFVDVSYLIQKGDLANSNEDVSLWQMSAKARKKLSGQKDL